MALKSSDGRFAQSRTPQPYVCKQPVKADPNVHTFHKNIQHVQTMFLHSIS